MLRFFIGFLCLLAVSGYPSSGKNEEKCCLDKLPPELVLKIMGNTDSIPTLYACAQSCENWHQILSDVSFSTLKYAFGQNPAKKKHLLQSLVEPSCASGNGLQEYLAAKHLDAIQSEGELCSVEQYRLVQAAVKYGNIDALNVYYDQLMHETANISSHMLERGLQPHLLMLLGNLKPTKRIVFDWLLDRLNQTEQDRNAQLDLLKISIAVASVEMGFAPVLWQDLDEFSRWELLRAAAKSGNHSLYNEYFLWLQDQIGPDNRINFLEPMAMCKNCNENDFSNALDAMRRQGLSEENLEMEHLPRAFLSTCTSGSPSMLTIFLEQRPRLRSRLLDCFGAAFESGNVENIAFLGVRFPNEQNSFLQQDEVRNPNSTRSISTWPLASVRHLVNEYSVEHLASLFALSNGAQHLLQYYSAHSCGNDQDMAVIRYLTTQMDAQVTDGVFMQFIRRPQFIMETEYQCDRYCHRNESTQALEFILEDLRFIPNQDHLNAALKTGRLDIVKIVYEMGRENGADLVIDRESLWQLKPDVSSALFHRLSLGSNQDLELLDYVFEKAFGKGWNRDSLSEEDMRVIREFHGAHSVGIFENVRTACLDCYYSYLRNLKLLE